MFQASRENAWLIAAQRWGSTFAFGGVVATCDPAIAKALFTLKAHSLGRAWPYRALPAVFPDSDGILFLEGDSWKRRHSAFTPLFSSSNVQRHTHVMFEAAMTVAHSNAIACAMRPKDPTCVLSPALPHVSGSGTCYDVLALVRAISMRVFLSWGMGLDADSPVSDSLADALDAYARTVLEILPSNPPPRAFSLGSLHCYASLFPLRNKLRALVARVCSERLYASGCTTNDQIAARADPSKSSAVAWAPADEVSAAAGCPPNFITRMLAAKFTPAEISSEVNHVHGAHKAVAFTATCALIELALPGRESIRAALVSEFESVCGRPDLAALRLAVASAACPERDAAAADGAALRSFVNASLATERFATQEQSGVSGVSVSSGRGWRIPTREDLEAGRLPLLGRVWRETLRRHVVSIGVLRRTGEDGVAGLPSGANILVLLHALHHDPAVWGLDAEVWDPDRWLQIHGCGERSGVSGTGTSNTPLQSLNSAPPLQRALESFFPFLDGARRCAGLNMAEMQFAMLLFVLVAVMRVEVVLPPVSEDRAASPDPVRCTVHAIPSEHAASRDPALAFHALVPQDNERQPFVLRKRDNMFAALDGRVPCTVHYR